MDLYINGHKVNSLKDASFETGSIGVYAGSIDTDNAQVAFYDLSVKTVWQAYAEGAVIVPQ